MFSNTADYISEKYKQFDKPIGNEFTSNVSFSQFEMFTKCPKRWELKYVKKIGKFLPSIHLVFGTAMHQCVQKYVTDVLEGVIKDANEVDYAPILASKMKSELDELTKTWEKKEPNRDDYTFTSKTELRKFFLDGMEIINYIKRDKHRKKYFDKRTYDMVAVELPIKTKIIDDYDVNILMFIDTVLFNKENDTYTIIDYKTSTKSWGKYQKEDKLKLSQALIYKMFFSKVFDIELSKVESKFLVLKREVNQDMFEGHTQVVNPSQGKPSLNKVTTLLEFMVKFAFNKDGSYKSNVTYPAIGGSSHKNCKFCEFRDTEHCPATNRLTVVDDIRGLLK